MRDELVIFGAGDIGRKTVEYFGARNVKFIIDNHKGGQYLCGVPVIAYQDFLRTGYNGPITVAVNERLFTEIKQQLRNDNYTQVELVRFDVNKWYKPNPRLQRLRNIHKGRRCFIIGNGPSLVFADLEKIHKHNEISFGFNAVYKAFDKTQWRPTYFMAGDRVFIDKHIEKLQDLDCVLLINADAFNGNNYLTGNNFYTFSTELQQRGAQEGCLANEYYISRVMYPAFSAEPDKFVYKGGTIAYAALQFAAYMGITEIYLLGIDLSYTSRKLHLLEAAQAHEADDNGCQEHFIENYHQKGDKLFTPNTERMHMSFACAEKYSRTHGFRIYNATRGGKLEAFERVDFYSLF